MIQGIFTLASNIFTAVAAWNWYKGHKELLAAIVTKGKALWSLLGPKAPKG